MIRVEDLGKKGAGTMQGDAKRAQGTTAPLESPFLETFEELEIASLLEEVKALGDRLCRFPSTSLMVKYRALVKQLLKKSQDGLKVRRGYRWQRTERTLFVVIQRTEAAIDELEALICSEGERAQVLDLVDEIKGCLISILT